MPAYQLEKYPNKCSYTNNVGMPTRIEKPLKIDDDLRMVMVTDDIGISVMLT